MFEEEEKKYNRKIPIIVFINKSDLKDKGFYIGTSILENWLQRSDIQICEASNYDFHSFNEPLRELLYKIPGLPLEANLLFH